MNKKLILSALLLSPGILSVANSTHANQQNVCAADYDEKQFVSIELDDEAKLVTNEAEIIINKPVAEVYRLFLAFPLEDQFPGTKKIPGVSSTRPINDKTNEEPGFARIVCLNDGTRATEEIIRNTAEKNYYYKVWDFTNKAAKSIKYATGEFTFTEQGDETHLHWQYSFKLDESTILGKLGPVGRWALKTFYVSTGFDELMNAGLEEMKRLYETSQPTLPEQV